MWQYALALDMAKLKMSIYSSKGRRGLPGGVHSPCLRSGGDMFTIEQKARCQRPGSN